MSEGIEARVEAAQIVSRVLDEGGYSNVLLAPAGELSEVDRARRAALVYGVLRNVPWIDSLLESQAGRAVDSLDPTVRSILRVGAFELVVKHAKAYAVVDSCVEATRRLGAPRAAGLVNAVLRKVATSGVTAPGPGSSVPDWIGERLGRTHGAGDAAAFLAASDAPAPVGVRFRDGRDQGSLGIVGASYVESVESLGQVSYDVVDPASTAVANAVGAEPGMRVLDIGAAPGGKTAALWDAMGGDGVLVALDSHRRRLARMRGRMRALGVRAALTLGDGRIPPFRPGVFDRVLLDAPCTGLGTLRRRPEIRYRIEESSPAALGELQRSLLDAALDLVRPGGRLVYSVCTVFEEETVAVVADRGAAPPPDLPGRRWGDGLLLAPHITDTDGMFIAGFDR